MRRLLAFVLFAVLAASAWPAVAAQNRYTAELSGQQEVPAVKTDASGDLKLNIYAKAVSFELSVTNLTGPVAANLHRGRRGENGPPVAGIFGGPAKQGSFSGVLAEGSITDESLLGELEGKKVADLVRLIRSGNIYVNISTGTFPDGEIRGQINK